MAIFNHDNDDHVLDIPLPGLHAPEVRSVFGLSPEEYPGDGLLVEADQEAWLAERLAAPVCRQQFDYFVEVIE